MAIDPCEGNPDPAACRAEDGAGAQDFPSINYPSASSSATATASAPATELPKTGGPSPMGFALWSLALLVASGTFAARLVHR